MTDACKLLSSIVSGGIAGAAATIPEAIAQTQQLSLVKPSPGVIIKNAYTNNGLFGLFRGTRAMMLRSAGFTAGYLGLMPMLSERIRQKTGDSIIADIFSAMVCGLLVGIVTTPPNTFRFNKQKNYMEKGPAPSYTRFAKEAFASKAGLCQLFAGIKPRTLMAMCSMFIIAESNKLCHLYSKNGFPDFPGLSTRPER